MPQCNIKIPGVNMDASFHALRESGARPPHVVAVPGIGIGRLGHLGAQFAVKRGYNIVAIARGKDKEPLARERGAQGYLDSQTQDVVADPQKLGCAKTILATLTNAKAMSSAWC